MGTDLVGEIIVSVIETVDGTLCWGMNSEVWQSADDVRLIRVLVFSVPTHSPNRSLVRLTRRNTKCQKEGGVHVY